MAAAQADQAPFAIVELSEPSLEAVARWHRPTFNGMYGDYRGPKAQKVDVGDTVQINIWETVSVGLYTTPGRDRLVPGSRIGTIPEPVVARDGTVNVP